jgi:hypothetical protein
VASTPDGGPQPDPERDGIPGAGHPTPQPPGRRFAPGMVALGVLLAVVTPIAAIQVVQYLGEGGLLLLVAAVLAPPVAGAVLVALPGSARRRGLGLGLLIGWGAVLVIAGGVCIALLAAFGGAS